MERFTGLTIIISSPSLTSSFQLSESRLVKSNCLTILLGTVVLSDSFFDVAGVSLVTSVIVYLLIGICLLVYIFTYY